MGKWSTPKKRKSTPKKSPFVRVKVTSTKTPTVTNLIQNQVDNLPQYCEKSPNPDTANPEWLQARIQVFFKLGKLSTNLMSVPHFSRLARCLREKSLMH